MVSDFNSGRKSIFHVSSIIARGDHLNEKAKAVNSVVRRLCQERNICFIDHENINPDIHLNNSRLHLSKSGTKVFARNLIRILSKYWWKACSDVERPIHKKGYCSISVSNSLLFNDSNVSEGRSTNLKFSSSNTDLLKVRKNNPNNVIIGHLNVNSVKNKFGDIMSYFQNCVDLQRWDFADSRPSKSGTFHVNSCKT